MALKQSPPSLVGVDTNVALDYADGREVVLDSIATIRGRIGGGSFCVPPTVVLELAHAADFGETAEKRAAATKFLRQHRAWNFRLINFVPLGELQVARIGQRLRERELIPWEEVNDALLVAESAALGCSVLLSSDEHLRGVEFERLSFELQGFDLVAPVIATPREIVQKFFR